MTKDYCNQSLVLQPRHNFVSLHRLVLCNLSFSFNQVLRKCGFSTIVRLSCIGLPTWIISDAKFAQHFATIDVPTLLHIVCTVDGIPFITTRASPSLPFSFVFLLCCVLARVIAAAAAAALKGDSPTQATASATYASVACTEKKNQMLNRSSPT